MTEPLRVYEIDTKKKYLLVFDEVLSAEAHERMQKNLEAWLENDAPFAALDGYGVKLLRVEDDDDRN